MWNSLSCEVIDHIITWSGPMSLATCKSTVAAHRIQRAWRRARVGDGMRVLYRFDWMKRWEVATAFRIDDIISLRGNCRLIFDARRLRVRIIPLVAIM